MKKKVAKRGPMLKRTCHGCRAYFQQDGKHICELGYGQTIVTRHVGKDFSYKEGVPAQGCPKPMTIASMNKILKSRR